MPSRFNLRKLIDTPSLHQDWGQGQDERRASWTELFTDLFYVMASAKVTELLVDRPDWVGAGERTRPHGTRCKGDPEIQAPQSDTCRRRSRSLCCIMIIL